MVVYKSVSPSLLSSGTGGEEWTVAENVPRAAPSLGKDPRRSEKKVGKGQGFTTGYGEFRGGGRVETPFLPLLASNLLRPEVWSGEAEHRACLCCLCEFLRSEVFNFCLLSPDGQRASLCYNLLEAPGPRHSDQSGRKQGMSHADRLGPGCTYPPSSVPCTGEF